MAQTPLPLLPGTLDVLVLAALEGDSRHGYDVAQWIRQRSGDALQIEDGALYTSLHRMEKRGLLASEWGVSESNRRARFYRLTAEGKRRLGEEANAWSRYASAVFRVLGTPLPAGGGSGG